MNKKIYMITIGFVVFVAIISLAYLLINNGNSYGKELQIVNLNEYTKGKPSSQDAIAKAKNELYKTVNANTPVENNSVNDIIIRNDSYSQDYNEGIGVHSVEFIVDSKSLKQSYLVKYQWGINKEAEESIDQYGTIATCLPKDSLIYGDFNCTDLSTEMSGQTKPYLNLDWFKPEDEYGNSVNSQFQPFEISFIEHQILGDYRSNNKIRRMRVNGVIEKVNRDVTKNNTLSFTVTVEGEDTYSVSINYNDSRYIKIKNNKTNKTIERRTEDESRL